MKQNLMVVFNKQSWGQDIYIFCSELLKWNKLLKIIYWDS